MTDAGDKMVETGNAPDEAIAVAGGADVARTPTPPTAAAAATERDVQRAALRELVRLLQECTVAEAKIEAALAEASAAVEQARQRATSDEAARNHSRTDAISQHAQELLTKLDAETAKARAQAKQGDESARRRINGECHAVEQESKTQLDKVAWIADSVLEATQNAARDDTKKENEKHAERIEQLQKQRNRALVLMADYGMQGQVPELEATAAADTSAAIDPAVPGAKRFTEELQTLERRVKQLGSLVLPRLFVGATLYLLPFALILVAAALTQVFLKGVPSGLSSPDWLWPQIGIAAGAMLVVCIIFGLVLRHMARKQVRVCYLPLHASALAAQRATDDALAEAEAARNATLAAARKKHDEEISVMRAKVAPVIQQARAKRDNALADQQSALMRLIATLDEQYARTRRHTETRRDQVIAGEQAQHEKESATIGERYESEIAAAQTTRNEARAELEAKWTSGLARIRAPMGPSPAETNGQMDRGDSAPAPTDWEDPAWPKWRPPKRFEPRVRFGALHVDVCQMADDLSRPRTSADGSNASSILGDGLVAAGGTFRADSPEEAQSHRLTLPLPDDFSVPALLAFPRQASLLIQHDRGGRARAIATLQMLMARLLTTQPAGRVRFTIIDPVGLGQNFAGFMHLADHDETLVGTRIWTNAEQIEQRLADLAEHMETVIQKYLRNEFPTIDDYNAQAGELAEPYRFLVIADYPAGFSPEACRKLASIAGAGARCGVYTLIGRDRRVPMPQGAHIEDIESASVNLVPLTPAGPSSHGDEFVWQDDVFRRFPLRLDDAPPEANLTRLLHTVGQFAKEANRVEVPFTTIAPPAEEFWNGGAASELKIPIGRSGATRLQYLRLGRGVAQHALIAGKTGSGKSTLLNAIITNVAMWYSPQEVELYLVDFKKGVEFKAYAENALPHARAIAVESDREFGLSVLQRIDAELTRRGELFRKAGVQDLAAYRQSPGAMTMPRTLLIVDEFQEFFSEDDRLSQDAAVLIDRLVRQGRAFGTHVLLGSQTLGGTSGLSRSTLGQMAVRVALQCTETDSQLILGDNNLAARLLSRPGEAIYNDAGGLVENNSPFQIAWLPDEQREKYLRQVAQLRDQAGNAIPIREPVVFEGNAPADISRDRGMAALIASASGGNATATVAGPIALLGDPVAIKEPTAVQFRRQAGTNVLIVGQQEESAMALFVSSMLSLAAQLPAGKVDLHIFDGSPADSPLARWLPAMKELLPRRVTLVDWRTTNDAIAALAEELARRQKPDAAIERPVVLFVYGLQRYRMLRKQEEDFSFSASAEKKPDPAGQFAAILREGPPLGMHVMAWCDTLASVERTLDRGMLREFDYRILFQMSANDSSTLIDSPVGNKLGSNRALVWSEEKGTMEKFRPFGLPAQEWLGKVSARLSGGG